MADKHVLVTFLVPVPEGMTPGDWAAQVAAGVPERELLVETYLAGPRALEALRGDRERLRHISKDHGYALWRALETDTARGKRANGGA